ncbi:MAG: enoyl-CoA hydratase/isomerase family protein [Candidatus Saliniplasma sp.]
MIELEKDDEIPVIKIDNPPMNAICTELLDDLSKTLDLLEDDEGIRVIVLTGVGKAFVAGADIAEMKDMSPKRAEEFSKRGQELFQRIDEFSVPVIAAVDGYALGGGMELAMSCDIIITSERSVFGQPEVGLGVIPGFGGTQRLPRIVGIKKAKELIMTGKKIDAEEAGKIGLVNMIIDSENFMEEVIKVSKTISKNGPLSVKYAKRAINEGSRVKINKGLDIEAEMFKKCFETEDQKTGMDAFLNKKEPEFKGK